MMPLSDPEVIDVLRRFVKKVADYSNDSWLARAADELVTLYGSPDAPKTRGIINANAHAHKWTVVIEEATDQTGPFQVAVCGCGATRAACRHSGYVNIREIPQNRARPRSMENLSDR